MARKRGISVNLRQPVRVSPKRAHFAHYTRGRARVSAEMTAGFWAACCRPPELDGLPAKGFPSSVNAMNAFVFIRYCGARARQLVPHRGFVDSREAEPRATPDFGTPRRRARPKTCSRAL